MGEYCELIEADVVDDDDGGVTYTVGALLYAFGKFKYSHMIWHIFVILAGVFMFISINFFILQYRV